MTRLGAGCLYAVVLYIINWVMQIYAFSTLWFWFIVPTFHAPALLFWVAWGVVSIYGLIHVNNSEVQGKINEYKAKSNWEQIELVGKLCDNLAGGAIAYGITLLLGSAFDWHFIV